MTRKNKRKSKKIPRRGGSRDTIVVPCRSLTDRTLSGGAFTINIAPSTFNEASAIADVFELYRVTRLRYRLHRSTTWVSSTEQTAVYLPGVVDTPPASVTSASASQHCSILMFNATVPTSWTSVPKRALESYGIWYKTIAGTPDPAQELQGQIFLNGAGTDIVTIEVEVVFEFKSPCNSGVSPAERARLAMARERERILRILGSAAPASTTIQSLGPSASGRIDRVAQPPRV